MVRKGITQLLIFGIAYHLINIAFAIQQDKNNHPYSDSLVTIEGSVFDQETFQPIDATICYRRLPYGSEYGIINTKDTCGSYEIYLFKQQNYQITVKADGYFAKIEQFDLRQGIKNINKNFYLHPISEGKILKLNHLNFDQGDHKILDESYLELDQLAQLMKENNDLKITLEGHTDFRGSDKQNLKLSKKRVKEVKKHLVQLGIKRTRIKTKSFGGSKPLRKENTPEAKKMNRRVEIRITSM